MADSKPARVPLTPEEIAEASAARELPVPLACAEGVGANLKLLARHLEILRTAGSERPS